MLDLYRTPIPDAIPGFAPRNDNSVRIDKGSPRIDDGSPRIVSPRIDDEEGEIVLSEREA